MTGTPASRRKRSLAPLAWAALPVISLSIGVFASGVGIDILVVAAACLLMLTIERTVGDWMAELIGAGPTALLFVSIILLGCWYFLGNAAGAARTDSFFAAAESRGYHTVYYQRTPAPVDATANNTSASASPADAGSTGTGAGGSRESSEGAIGTKGRGTSRVVKSASGKPDRQAEVEPAPAAKPPAGAPPAQGRFAGASRILFGERASQPAAVTSSVTLTISPSEVPVARRATLQAMVSADGRPLTEGWVEFTVDGVAAGKVTLDSRGIAATTFATYIAGSYEVSARFGGAGRFQSSTSGVRTLSVR